MLKQTFLLITFLLLTSISLAQPPEIPSEPRLEPAWRFLITRIEEFYRVPEIPNFQNDSLSSLVDAKIGKLGSRLPDFQSMVNSVDSKWKIQDLMRMTALQGFPAFGKPNSTINQDVRRMLFFIFERLEELPNQEMADRTFKKLAEGFLHCQDVQYRTVQDTFLTLMDKGSLKTRVALLLNELKKKWLMQTIVQMESLTSNSLNPHLENSYLKAIGEAFGISGYEEALFDRLAVKLVNKIEARHIFRSFVSVREIISFVHDDFTSSTDPHNHAEIFKLSKEKNYELERIYDEDGLITAFGTEQILVDLEVLEYVKTQGAQSVIKRQETLFESFLPSLGFSSWQDFEQTCKNTPLLAPLTSALELEEVKLAIYSPQLQRDNILRQGVLNQYQTHTSRGYLGLSGRFASERSHLDMTQLEYEEISLEDRPKYGMILGKPSFNQPLPHFHYGEDVFVLKLDKLNSRITWTPGGSSLNRHAIKANRLSADWRNGYPYEPNKWDDIFLPWSKRTLLLPFLRKGVFNEQGRFEYRPTSFFHSFSQIIQPRKAFKKMKSILAADYTAQPHIVEFQAWGTISPEDIESFTFTSSQPNWNTLSLLSNHQIGTYDGIRKVPTPYQTQVYRWDDKWTCQHFTFNFDTLKKEEVETSICANLMNEEGCDPTQVVCIGDKVYAPNHKYDSTVIGLFENGDAYIKNSNSLGTFRFPIAVLKK